MLRTVRFLLLCVWLTLQACAQDRPQQKPQVFVSVHNDAHVPDGVLRHAEFQAVAIFRKAGVDLHWADSSTANCPCYALRIIPHSQNLPTEIFGLAFLDSVGFGRQADIFFSNVSQLSSLTFLDQADVLGPIMAHELGHLLLGSNSHSAGGIMRLHWDEADLRAASLGRAGFDRHQAELIQQRLQADPTVHPKAELAAARTPSPSLLGR